MKDISLCLEVWGTDYEKIKQTCLWAEKLGYDGFYYGESLVNIDLDCWTVLSSLVPLTERIKLGPVITYLFPGYRSLALLAKQAITFQNISNGRLDFRTGPGAILQYATPWWYPYGIDYYNEAKRVSIFREGIDVLTMLLNDSVLRDSEPAAEANLNSSPVFYKGDYFTLNGAEFQKPENKIPITIAAKKYVMMQIAVQFADLWESSYLLPEEFLLLNKKFVELELLNSYQNKDYQYLRNVKRSIELDVLIADSHEELKIKKNTFVMERVGKEKEKEKILSVYDQILKRSIVGTPEMVFERVKEYVAVGIDQFLLAFQDPFDYKAMELFIKSVKSEI